MIILYLKIIKQEIKLKIFKIRGLVCIELKGKIKGIYDNEKIINLDRKININGVIIFYIVI